MKIDEIAFGDSDHKIAVTVADALRILRSGTLADIHAAPEGPIVFLVRSTMNPTSVRHLGAMIVDSSSGPCCSEDREYYIGKELKPRIYDELEALADINRIMVKETLAEDASAGATAASSVATVVAPLGAKNKKQPILKR